MITIGVTGWGDHDQLYTGHIAARDKLKEYSAHFPVVEVDSAFYAVQPVRNAKRWTEDTPDGFQFVVKAYQGMTGHERGKLPFESKEEMFSAFKESLQPYIDRNKLAMVLFQFPPWFDCQKKNVDYLRWCKAQMRNIPCALEFRHQSWFKEHFREKTLQFIKDEDWIHTICDEPQAGEGSIPIVLAAPRSDKLLVRFHGRNVHGWQKKNHDNWREVRYLYNYNKEELAQWGEYIRTLEQKCEQIYVLFNNNSGGDAADNAKQFIDMLGIEYSCLAPRQLDLF
ncbi:DUF72 domain-containing protein [Cytobacillus gottheilii]|uniref:DUF72 domain-containing protein n=1 Tax=Cytobacillus gottheilii TaxID=859144 RepID=UPI0009BB700C|nr:DUF72 domain-containing protein [Cytobacillus gottheilii]